MKKSTKVNSKLFRFAIRICVGVDGADGLSSGLCRMFYVDAANQLHLYAHLEDDADWQPCDCDVPMEV